MRRFGRALAGCGIATATALTLAATAGATASTVAISQVYGGGGNTGAPYDHDYVELHNRTGHTINVSGYAVQYSGAASSSTWEVNAIGGSIPAGGRYLVQLASGGANGAALVPDATPLTPSNMGGTGGKVALTSSTTALSGACPLPGAAILDLVGYGTPNCAETSPVGATSNTTAAIRSGGGCTDTDDNLADFALAAPDPHNSASAAVICNHAPVLAPIGDRSVDEGQPLAFTVSATDAESNPITYGAVGLPAGATLNPTTGEFAWTPTDSQAGTYPVTFSATDGTDTDTEPIQITVADVPGGGASEKQPTKTSVKAKAKGKKVKVSGAVAPAQDGSVKLTLLRAKRKGAKPKPFRHGSAKLGADGTYATALKRKRKGSCRVEAEWAGDADSKPSSASAKFKC